jgi:hypothetical protein
LLSRSGMNELTGGNEPIDLRDLGRGIALRAGILTIGGVIVGGWLAALAFKTAGKLVRVLVGLILLLITGTFVTYEVNKAKRHLEGSEAS